MWHRTDASSVRLGVGINFATPALVDSLRRSWLSEDVPHVFVGDADDAQRRLVQVPLQEEIIRVDSDLSVTANARRRYSECIRAAGGRSNHQGDNRPLALVRIANVTIVQHNDLDWLAIGDADTCFNMAPLRERLARIDPRRRLLLGTPDANGVAAPGMCPCRPQERNRTCRAFGCCALEDGSRRGWFYECLAKATPWSNGQSAEWRERWGRSCGENLRPKRWPFGGVGYILSRGLLDSMHEHDWRRCEDSLLTDGGDVRVAACILKLSGVGLTALHGLGDELSAHQAPGNCQGTWRVKMHRQGARHEHSQLPPAHAQAPRGPSLEKWKAVAEAASDVRPHFGGNFKGVGYCGVTRVGEGAHCRRKDKQGSWTMSEGGLDECYARCRACTFCRFISFNPVDNDCSWFRKCTTLHTGASLDGYFQKLPHRTYQIRASGDDESPAAALWPIRGDSRGVVASLLVNQYANATAAANATRKGGAMYTVARFRNRLHSRARNFTRNDSVHGGGRWRNQGPNQGLVVSRSVT